MGVLEGNNPATDNDWETVKRGGDIAIERWILNQMEGKTCCVVLIGKETATRRWIKFEIKKAWEKRLGVLGIYIHNLKDREGKTSIKGTNPFSSISFGSTNLGMIVKAYDPSPWGSVTVYENIKNNISKWIEEAISIRAKY